MTQDELDRLLKEALDVEPPAGYVARVRARVTAERVTSAGGRAWWPLGALACAVLVLVAGGLLLERDNSPVPVSTMTWQAPGNVARDGSESAHAPTGTPAGDTRGAVVRHQPRTSANGAAGTRGPMRTPDALPAVLISPDDAIGLRLLATVTEAALGATVTGGGEPAAQISRIDVAPIEVDSLPELTPLALGELQ